MTISIEILDEQSFLSAESNKLLHDVILKAADHLSVPTGELTITIVDNKEIQIINQEHRDKDQPTDVLSFPMYEPDEFEELRQSSFETIEGTPILGDIIISYDKVKEQAVEYGHSFERELGFLAVHGFLHIIGYDHLTEDDEQKMFGLQDEILNAFGLVR